MFQRAIFLMTLLCSILALPACAGPVTYSAEPTEATVVDAETKQPLEGVIVVAHWVLEGGVHVSRVGELKILETTTDQNGRFVFPAWGPIRHWDRSRLTYMDPELLIFKSGYYYQQLNNFYEDDLVRFRTESIEGKYFPVRKSMWNGKTIALKPFKGGLKQYEELFEDFNHELERIAADQPTKCYWKNIQKTIRAMNRERNRLVDLGVNPNTLSTIDKRLLMSDEFFTKKGGCGSPKEFFGEFQQ